MAADDIIEDLSGDDADRARGGAAEDVSLIGDGEADKKGSPVLKGDGPPGAFLNGEIEVLSDRRLPYLDKGPVKAYAARLRGTTGQPPYFAMICERHLTPRSRTGPSYAGIINTALVKLIGSGPVFWPPEGIYRYCFVYENTLGQPLMREGEQGLGWRPDQVMKAVIVPMVGVLIDMRDSDIVHGDIRPTNIFDGGDKVVEKVILGECLSTPSSYMLPSVFEPIERAMCDPIAKGKGVFEDDLYSFGVSLVMLMRRNDPLLGMSNEQIIREKMEVGSYTALTGNDRFTGGVLELLRGVLHDDLQQRWSLTEVMSWMDGQRLSPKQMTKKKKAPRPIIFNGEKYYRQTLLAMDLSKNQAEAVQLIDSGALTQWVDRSLEDNNVSERLDAALEAAQEMGRGPGYWDRLISRVSIALDPDAPMRFKNFTLHPEGVAAALAEAVALKRDIQACADLMTQNLVMYWLNAQTSMKLDIGSLVSRFDSCRSFLRQPNMGYGIERCLYYLNPEAPCMSDRLKKYYVRTPEDMMRAFEEIAASPERPELFIDRHIAAFLSVRDRKVIDAQWPDLNASEYYRRVSANFRAIASVQKRSRMEAFPALTAWAVSVAEPLYERYHDRELRVRMREKAEKLKDSGDMVKLLAVIDDSATLQKDFANFRAAMQEYGELREELRVREAAMEDPATFGLATAREISAIVSGVLSALAILGFSLLFFLKKGMF